MPEPTSSSAAAFALTASGLSVFGLVTGIHPMLLVAGFVGGWWYNSYGQAMPIGQRISSGLIAALVAAWMAPPIVAWLTGSEWWPKSVPAAGFSLAAALVIGFLTHKVVGPTLLRLAQKKADEIAS